MYVLCRRYIEKIKVFVTKYEFADSFRSYLYMHIRLCVYETI